MRLSDYKNKLSEDLQYWNEVNKAKCPDGDLKNLVPPLSDEDKMNLPIEIRSFYNMGRWFFNFVNSVVVPYNRVLLLYSKRHILECFKSNIVYDEHYIDEATPDEIYDLLKFVPFDSAKGICKTICENSEDAQTLITFVEQDDLSGFTYCISKLGIPSRFLIAFTKTNNLLKHIEYIGSMSNSESISDFSEYTYVLKSHFSEVSSEIDLVSEVTNYAMRMIDSFLELADCKNNTDIQEYIINNFSHESWYVLAKRFFSSSVYSMRRIWNDLSHDEKNIVDNIINPEREMVIVVNGEKVRPTNDIIQLALRWSKIFRKKVLDRDKEMGNVVNRSKKTAEIHSFSDYSWFCASEAPNIDYKTMRNIADRLAGRVKKDRSIEQTQVAYIQAVDRLRFCYFFLNIIGYPDNIADVDFSKPIQWLGSWESLKYLVYRLYSKSLPANLAEYITEAFRFRLKRQRNKEEKGKITKSTFNNSKNILTIIDNKDKKRIDTILKEFEPFMQRQS